MSERITPGSLQRSGHAGRSASKQALGGSKTSMAAREGPLRPPPGFVSYQIPNGAPPPPPSDNIHMYDARRFMSVGSLMGSRPMAGHGPHHQNGGGHASRYSRQNSGGSGGCVAYITAREPPVMMATAGVYPAHLHNGGRMNVGGGGGSRNSHSNNNNGSSNGHYHSWPSPPPSHHVAEHGHSHQHSNTGSKQQHVSSNSARPPQQQFDFYQPPPWAGERLAEPASVASKAAVFTMGGDSPAEPRRRYPTSPVPGRTNSSATAANYRSYQRPSPATGSDGGNNPRRPPLPETQPRPPPRSRPRSWTSTLFSAMLRGNGSSKKNSSGGDDESRDQDEYTRDQDQEKTSTYTADQEYYDGPDYYQYSSAAATAAAMRINTPGALRDPAAANIYSTGTLEKRSKQVRFLANPSKQGAEASLPRFYSLPRFILPTGGSGGTEQRDRSSGGRRQSGGGDAPAKIKMRSRTPSPFGRFVKSLVRGKLNVDVTE